MYPLAGFLIVAGLVVAGVQALRDIMNGRRKVFVSFDYENDKHYKFLLAAWNANKEFDFKFNDASSGEIASNDVGRVKATLTYKIREADELLVLVGKYANALHKDRLQIGHRNWQNFEIAKAKEAGKPIIAVKLDRFHESPEELLGANASWAYEFSDKAVTNALRQAR